MNQLSVYLVWVTRISLLYIYVYSFIFHLRYPSDGYLPFAQARGLFDTKPKAEVFALNNTYIRPFERTAPPCSLGSKWGFWRYAALSGGALYEPAPRVSYIPLCRIPYENSSSLGTAMPCATWQRVSCFMYLIHEPLQSYPISPTMYFRRQRY